MKKIISICLALLMTLTFTACGSGGDTHEKNGGKSMKKAKIQYDAGESADALLDYAKRLQAAGNKEAAKAVYQLIDKAAAADGIYNSIKGAYDASLMGEMDEILSITQRDGD